MKRLLNFHMCKARHFITKWPRTVALVGNSSNSEGYGDQIDGHDCVVRLNRAPYYGAAGLRTDVLVINNWGFPSYAMTRGTMPINEHAFESAKMIWLPVPAEEMKPVGPEHQINLPWPAFADFTDDVINSLVGTRPYRQFPPTIWRALIQELRILGAEQDKVPSTGAQALAYIVRVWPKANVSLFGFSHEGWSGHPWEAEAAWIKNLPNVVYGNKL